jgi:hypothetical protein
MPGIGLLHTWLSDACPSIHRARLSALVKVVHSLLVGGRLRLTDLGRQLQTSAFANHTLKCVDRLLGTPHLQHERIVISRAVAQWVWATTPRPVLLVDWSEGEPGHTPLMLKAAVPWRGRALSRSRRKCSPWPAPTAPGRIGAFCTTSGRGCLSTAGRLACPTRAVAPPGFGRWNARGGTGWGGCGTK